MASIYKKGRSGKGRAAPWFISYFDEDGKRRTLKGFTDKGESERLAARLEHEVMLKRRGLIDPELEARAKKRKVPSGGVREEPRREYEKARGARHEPRAAGGERHRGNDAD
jgi:hypothetical protein